MNIQKNCSSYFVKYKIKNEKIQLTYIFQNGSIYFM